jgi:ABC-2 type transport system permease protein
MGGFCFVLLNYFLITFLFQKITIGPWTQKEMIVFLGNFYIIWYAIFFFFYRGYVYLIRYIRSGLFDYYLIRPADTQFLVSVIGGGIHNLIAIIFGVVLLIYGLVQLQLMPSILSIALWPIVITSAILDCYGFILLLVMLNFRYGYLEEVVNLAFSVQEFSRYPIDAFTRMPVYIFLFALPFSAVATMPSILLMNKLLPFKEIGIFLMCSGIFLFIVRRMWLAALRNYTSVA